MGSSKSGSTTVGYRYYMSILMGLCRGPVDEIVQIDIGSLRAWPTPEGDTEDSDDGNALMLIAEGPDGTGIAQYEDGTSAVVSGALINTIRGTGSVQIEAGNLFGGDKKEGGIQGPLRTMLGYTTQIVPAYIKTLIGGNVSDMRGVTTLFFDGLLTSLNPYPKKWRFRVRRTTNGWDGDVWQPDLATIWLRDGMIKAMNPAHIIYECLTNRDWGRGYPRSWIYEEACVAVAQKLYDESLGLCLYWNRKQDLSAFVGTVIDHIGGSLYVDRTRGLIAFSLLRGDYDPDDIPLFTYDTGLLDIEDPETASQEDVVNEIVVKWYDPIVGEQRQGRVQNLASIRANAGGVNSQDVDYGGAPVVDMALRLAQRDLKANANSLKRFKVILDRRAWKIIPGGLFRVSAPKHDIYNLVLRAGKISEGALPDGRITVEAVLDVFGLPSASFAVGQESTWTPPNRSAQIASTRFVREATYAELVRSVDKANLALIPYDTGAVAVIASKPSSMSQGYNIATAADGETISARGSGAFAPYAETTASVSIYQTEIPFIGGMDLGLVDIGTAAQIGDEICRVDAITVASDNSTGVITVSRGCVDTLPRAHSAATPIIFYESGVGTDNRQYEIGEEVDVKVLTYTSSATLSLDLAPTDTLVIAARQGRPIVPGDLKINSVPFGNITSLSGTLYLEWTHRDRLLAQDQLIPHQGSSMGPEAGVTYSVNFKASASGANLLSFDSIATNTLDVTASSLVSAGITSDVWIELFAVRDGLRSHNSYLFGATYSP